MSRKDIRLGDGSVARPGKKRKHLKPYTTLYESNFRDVPKTLRKIAKQIENGELANVNEAAVVLDSSDGEYHVFGFGPHYADINGTHVLFTMGTRRLEWCLDMAKKIQKESYTPPPKKVD